MPYTERQLRCLSAMGLVAWRLRDAAPVAAAVPARASVEPATSALPEAARAVTAGSAALLSAPPPSAPAASSLETTEAVPTADSSASNSAPDAAPDAGPDASPDVSATPAEAPAGEPPAVESPADRPGAVVPVELPPAAAAPPGAEPLAAPALAVPLPREPVALAAWLPDQPLAPFVWKERRLTRIGRDDAPLLVVVEREPADSLPLEGAAAELFERMLGAIGRTRRDTCQCVLSVTPEPGGDTVAALAGTARPITLVLVRELDDALDADGCRLPGDPFGGSAWCLPHPDVLLAEPARKRQAWVVLKTVRSHLPLLP